MFVEIFFLACRRRREHGLALTKCSYTTSAARTSHVKSHKATNGTMCKLQKDTYFTFGFFALLAFGLHLSAQTLIIFQQRADKRKMSKWVSFVRLPHAARVLCFNYTIVYV